MTHDGDGTEGEGMADLNVGDTVYFVNSRFKDIEPPGELIAFDGDWALVELSSGERRWYRIYELARVLESTGQQED